MSSMVAATGFATTAIKLYPPYRWDDEQESTWIEAVIRHLARYPAEVITAAQDKMLETRERKEGIPTVAECIGYCKEAQHWAEAANAKKEGRAAAVLAANAQIDNYGTGFADKKILEEPLAKQAAREDWIQSLHAFIAEHLRMPAGPEIAQCKASSKETMRFIETAIRQAHEGRAQGVAGKAAETMLAKRKEMADRVLDAK